MFRLTVSLSLVLGLGAVAGGLWAPAAVQAAPDAPVDPVADWDARWEKSKKDAAAEYMKIVKKYVDKLEASSAYVRWRALRYLPDDEENRKFLGYIKEKLNDGTENTKWVRYDVRRDQLKEMTDLDDPKSTKYSKDLADADKKVAGMFKGLAKKAAEYGSAKDASADAKWGEKAQRAWEKLLEIDDSAANKDAEEAHKTLNHPKFEGKYVTPFKLQFVKARADRKRTSEKEAAAKITPADAVEPDGIFVSAGLTGGGAKSAHFVVNTSYGKETAIRLVQQCEKTLNDLVEIYGYPENVKERLPIHKFDIVKNDDEEFRKILEKGAGMKPAEVQRLIDHHLGGTGAKGDYVSRSSGGADADDLCMNATANFATQYAGQGLARADLGSSAQDPVEDWLWQSIGYDITKRVNGTALTIWAQFGRYGDMVEARPGEDKWVELARRQVQGDDDVALSRLVKLKQENQDFKGPETIKGWAFIQFVFEKDPAKAKQFIWQALANGTPAACAAIYPDNVESPDPVKSMEKLDAEYREWILKAW